MARPQASSSYPDPSITLGRSLPPLCFSISKAAITKTAVLPSYLAGTGATLHRGLLRTQKPPLAGKRSLVPRILAPAQGSGCPSCVMQKAAAPPPTNASQGAHTWVGCDRQGSQLASVQFCTLPKCFHTHPRIGETGREQGRSHLPRLTNKDTEAQTA